MNQFKHAKWWRSYLDKLWQSFWKLKFMKNQAFELHSPLPKSFKVCKEGTMEKRKIEDSSCSLLSHFWSTFRSTYYIPFQRSGSQESKTSNRVRFGAEMRKIWPSEDNCSRLVRNSHNTFSLCQIRTTPSPCAKFAPAHVSLVRNLLCFADSTWDIFFYIFWCKFLSYPYN